MDSIKKRFIDQAKNLNLGDLSKLKTGPYRTTIVQTIADRYNRTKDVFERDNCAAGLMLLFWGEARKMQVGGTGITHYEYEDYVQHLYLCIQNACDYHAWDDGSTTAEACIRQSIARRGIPALRYEANLDKHKANGNTMSLDSTPASTDDDTPYIETIEDRDSKIQEENAEVESIVQYFINNNKIIESIIIDLIAFNNCAREIKETVEVLNEETGQIIKYDQYSREFWPYKLVQLLNNLSAGYSKYFKSRYDIATEALNAALANVKKTNSTKLYKSVEKTLAELKVSLNM